MLFSRKEKIELQIREKFITSVEEFEEAVVRVSKLWNSTAPPLDQINQYTSYSYAPVLLVYWAYNRRISKSHSKQETLNAVAAEIDEALVAKLAEIGQSQILDKSNIDKLFNKFRSLDLGFEKFLTYLHDDCGPKVYRATNANQALVSSYAVMWLKSDSIREAFLSPLEPANLQLGLWIATVLRMAEVAISSRR